MPLRVGIYTVKAYSFGKQENAQGFDAEPYYAGQEDVVLEANKAKTVSIVCKLAQSMVSVARRDNFKRVFPSLCLHLERKCGLRHRLCRQRDPGSLRESRTAADHFPELGKRNTFKQQIVAEALAAYHYNITLDITEGNSEFDISVDETIHQYDVTL